MKSSLRLTTLSKVLILVAILAIIGGGIYAGVSKGMIKTSKDVATESKSNNDVVKSAEKVTTDNSEISVDNVDADGNVINTSKSSSSTINLSLDEWIG